MPKIKTPEAIDQLHADILRAVRDFRRPTPRARKAVEDAMDVYRAAWLGEPATISTQQGAAQ